MVEVLSVRTNGKKWNRQESSIALNLLRKSIWISHSLYLPHLGILQILIDICVGFLANRMAHSRANERVNDNRTKSKVNMSICLFRFFFSSVLCLSWLKTHIHNYMRFNWSNSYLVSVIGFNSLAIGIVLFVQTHSPLPARKSKNKRFLMMWIVHSKFLSLIEALFALHATNKNNTRTSEWNQFNPNRFQFRIDEMYRKAHHSHSCGTKNFFPKKYRICIDNGIKFLSSYLSKIRLMPMTRESLLQLLMACLLQFKQTYIVHALLLLFVL